VASVLHAAKDLITLPEAEDPDIRINAEIATAIPVKESEKSVTVSLNMLSVVHLTILEPMLNALYKVSVKF